MSTMQVALAALGGVILAVVVAQGAWSSRQNKPRQAEEKPPSGFDVNRSEPSLDADLGHEDAHASAQADGSSHEPDASHHHHAFSQSAHVADHDQAGAQDLEMEVSHLMHHADKGYMLDALIDVITPIEIDTVVAGELALSHMPLTRRVGGKLFTIEGLNAHRGEWEVIKAGQRYSAFQAGVQLANRLGPLNEIEFSEYVLKVQRFADSVGGEPEFTDMLEEVARARELDQFAGEHDAQLIFQIKAQRLAWSPGFVQQHAAKLGFVAGAIPGRMVIPAKAVGLQPILVLSFDTQAALADDPSNSAIRLLSLTLDVPQVEQSDEPFRRMWFIAQELSQSMEGTITDDQGYVLTSNALANIEQDLLALYEVLASRDLASGSPQARRLFS
jgi:ZipA, C-terminal FtsZ-binding domain